jgi:hypothetical protein
MLARSIINWVGDITWSGSVRGAGFMLFYSALCMFFSLTISSFAVLLYLINHSSDFITIFIFLGLQFGVFGCAVAFPVHVLIYIKAPRNRVKWYATFVSLGASIGVWLFFSVLMYK